MVAIPSIVVVGLIWLPAISSVVLSFTKWNGIGNISADDFIGLTNYGNVATNYPPFWPAMTHNLIWLAVMFLVATPFGMFLAVPIMVMTPRIETARRLGLLWGVHAVHTRDVDSFEEMVAKSKRMALRHHIAKAGDRLILCAGVPFKTPGSTNVLHVVTLVGDELKHYKGDGDGA